MSELAQPIKMLEELDGDPEEQGESVGVTEEDAVP